MEGVDDRAGVGGCVPLNFDCVSGIGVDDGDVCAVGAIDVAGDIGAGYVGDRVVRRRLFENVS